MKCRDIARLALQTAWQRKMRTVLNLFGVFIGAFIVVFTFAACEGIDQTVTRIYRTGDVLRSIIVSPNYDFVNELLPEDAVPFEADVDPQRRARIRSRVAQDWLSQKNRWRPRPLTLEDVETIRRMPHVEAATPTVFDSCVIAFGDREKICSFQGIPDNDRNLTPRLVAGTLPDPNLSDQVLVSEYLAFLWGSSSDTELADLVGKQLEFKFRLSGPQMNRLVRYAKRQLKSDDEQADNAVPEKINLDELTNSALKFDETSQLIRDIESLPDLLAQQGVSPERIELIQGMLDGQSSPDQQTDSVERSSVLTKSFTIAGIVRDSDPDDQPLLFGLSLLYGNTDILLPIEEAVAIVQQKPTQKQDGFYSAKIVVDDEAFLDDVSQQIEAMNLRQNSLRTFLEFFRGQIAIGRYAIASIALVVFLVSAMGIANTMIMTVMERRFEIGMMKAVGARNRQIVGIFLAEGALIGCLGSLSATGLAWIAASTLNNVVRERLSARINLDLQESVFVFSPFMILLIVSFSTLVTLLATVIPAWRAARIDPIIALRAR